MSHAHKCCPDTWSGKNKNSLLARPCPVSVVGRTPEASVSDVLSLFFFSPSPPLFFPSGSFGVVGIHSLCQLAAKEEVMVCSLVCRAVGKARGKCDTADLNKHDETV